MPLATASSLNRDVTGKSSGPRLFIADEACPTCDQPIPHDHYEEIKERIELRQREQSAEIAARLQEQHAVDKAQAVEQAWQEAESKIVEARDEERQAAEMITTERVTAVERAGKEAQALLQGKLDEAESAKSVADASIEKMKEEAVDREKTIRAEAMNEAEAKMLDKLNESERNRRESEAILIQKIETIEADKAAVTTTVFALQTKLDEQQHAHVDALEKLRSEGAVREEEIRSQASVAAQLAFEEKTLALTEGKSAAEAKAALFERQVETLKRTQEIQLQEQREVLEKAKGDAINAEKATAFGERLKLQSKIEELGRALDKKTAEELGEGAEIDLYESLKLEFPSDRIERIQKGQPGADILHVVIHNGKECGKIVYDSKNHGSWRNDFVSKLAKDQMAARAEHAILSTSKFPAGIRHLHVQDGVILCGPARVVTVVQIVRQHLTRTHTLRLSSEQRLQKTAALYDFITSERCTNLFGRIDSHTEDLLDLQVKEKKAHEITWKKQGELIRSVQRVRAEVTNEIESIVGAIEQTDSNQ